MVIYKHKHTVKQYDIIKTYLYKSIIKIIRYINYIKNCLRR